MKIRNFLVGILLSIRYSLIYSCKKCIMSAYLFIHLVDHLQLSFSWFLLQFMDLCSVFVWLLNQFHLVAIYWLVCRDRNSPLCHIRVSLTSCIGAGHIIFFAGIDSTGNQVTLWTYTFVLLIKCCCSCNCLFVFCCLFDCLFFFLSGPASLRFKDWLIYRGILFSCFLFVCLFSCFLCFSFALFFLFTLVFVSFCFSDCYFSKYHLSGK